MTTPHGVEPEIPDALRPKWDELGQAIARLEAARAAVAEATADVQSRAIDLLRDGLRRELLVGHPYSSSRITQLQRKHGLIGPRPTTPEDD